MCNRRFTGVLRSVTENIKVVTDDNIKAIEVTVAYKVWLQELEELEESQKKLQNYG